MEIVDSTGYVIRAGKIESVVISQPDQQAQTKVFFEQDSIRLAKVYGEAVDEAVDESRNYIKVTCVDGSFYTYFDSVTITSNIPFLRKTGKRIIVGIDGSVRVKILNYIG